MNLFKKTIPEPEPVQVKGRSLICPHCSNDLFWVRKAQLNRASSSFFGIDWTDRSATCFVCSECTRIEWFLGEQGKLFENKSLAFVSAIYVGVKNF